MIGWLREEKVSKRCYDYDEEKKGRDTRHTFLPYLSGLEMRIFLLDLAMALVHFRC